MPEYPQSRLAKQIAKTTLCLCGHTTADHRWADYVWGECLLCAADAEPRLNILNGPCQKYNPITPTGGKLT